MFVDARTVSSESIIETDICVVGAGVAGITLAREFLGTNTSVTILESGGFEGDKETQDLYKGETVGHPYYPLETARVRQYGGCSEKWLLEFGQGVLGARLRPLSEIDFEEREWVPYSGWPFNKAHLDPYYERAQAVCKAGPYIYDIDSWGETQKTPRFPLKGNRVQTVVYQGVNRDLFRLDYREELKRSDNVTVYLHANALEIETNDGADETTGIRAACLHGPQFRVRAKVYIVAVNGIETPRLLLLSNRIEKAGLGNRHDLVGRFFMEHPHLWSGLYIPSDRKLFRTAGLYDLHIEKGVPVIGQLTISEDVLQQEKMLNYSVVIEPSFRPSPHKQGALARGKQTYKALASALLHGDMHAFTRQMSTLVPVTNALSVAVYRKVMRILNSLLKLRKHEVFLLNHMVEQVPNPESRVTLGNSMDAFGQRCTRLDWQLSPIDIRSIVRAQEIIDEELRRAGLGHLEIELRGEVPPPDLHGGWHQMGTTRMHNDPRMGVVDSNSRVHGVSNLYLAGPSVFPTGGCANPVLTIVALTLRLADHLKNTVFHKV